MRITGSSPPSDRAGKDSKVSDYRILAIIGIPMFLLVFALAYIQTTLNIEQAHKLAQAHLVAVTQGVSEAIDNWLREKEKQLQVLAATEAILRYDQGDHPDIRSSFENMIRINQDLENAFIADAEGTILIDGLDSSPQTVRIRHFERFKESLGSSPLEAFIDEDIYRSPATGRLTTVIMVRIPRPSESSPRYLCFALNWERFIEKFIIPIEVGETGYVAVTDQRGRNIAHPDRSLNLQNLSHLDFIQRMLAEKTGFQQYVFNGIPKYMAYRELMESGWIVMSSVNERELIAGAIYARNIMLFIGVVTLLTALFVVGWLDSVKLRRAQRERRLSEHKFHLIFSHGNDGIYVHSIDAEGVPGPFEQINDNFRRLFRVTEKEIRGLSPLSLIQVSGERSYLDILREVLNKRFDMQTIRLVGPEGKRLDAEFRLFLFESQGRSHILGFVRDITEKELFQERLERSRDELDRKVKDRTLELSEANKALKNQILEKENFEKALRESEEKYRNFVERANDGILVIQDWVIRYANPRMTQMLGMKEGSLFGNALIDIIPESERSKFKKKYTAMLTNRSSDKMMETRLRGERSPDVEINSGLIVFEGRPADFVIVREVTERKRAERDERLRREQLIQTDKLAALGTLVSGVAHEINNPNNAIMLNTPILADVWKDAAPVFEEYHKHYGDFMLAGMPYSLVKGYARDLIHDMAKSSERIKTIVEDLKNFARPNPFDLTEDVDINQVIEQAVKLITNLIRKSTDAFHVEYNPEAPLIRGNFQRLEQVMVNLIQNACHALTDKSQAVLVSVDVIEKNLGIIVRVRDEGSGIEPDQLKRITDPFFTTKRDRGGTGLGLSVSLSIVKDHGGDLSFDSYPAKGTEVRLRLPLPDRTPPPKNTKAGRDPHHDAK